MEAMQSSVARIREKLDRLRQEGWERHAGQLGVDRHQFRLSPPASEEDVAAFEATHGIELPADYRIFLRELGDGGAGPYYGILPLSRWGDHLGYFVEPVPGDYLARPNLIPLAFDRTDDWNHRLGIADDALFQGTIAICDQGCTYLALLVVSGPARGRVLYVDLDLQPPLFVSDLSFLAWYERWLDETLAGMEIVWFGCAPPR
jgi:hypothetical protein